jgi:MFS transporter, FHS family, L-fucose permease
MPEITDADMGTQEMEIAEYDPGPLSKQYNLFLAVWSQFTYLGAQVSVANYFVNFCEEAGKDAFTSCELYFESLDNQFLTAPQRISLLRLKDSMPLTAF